MIVMSPKISSLRIAVSNPSQSSVIVMVKVVPVERICDAISSPIVSSGFMFSVRFFIWFYVLGCVVEGNSFDNLKAF